MSSLGFDAVLGKGRHAGRARASLVAKHNGGEEKWLAQFPEAERAHVAAGGRVEVDEDGDRTWRNASGKLHREGGPAVERASGSRYWYRNGERHREDGPAVERENGSRYWYLNGELHREGGPAIEHAPDTREWWRNGKRHREDGPAIELPSGLHYWYLNGDPVDPPEDDP